MFCPKCGAQNGDDSAFCIQCGGSLQNTPQQPPMQQAPIQQPPSLQGGYVYTGATPPQPGYYSPGFGAAGQASVMTAAPKKPNYTLIGILSVAAVAVIVIAIVLVFVVGGNPLVGTWISAEYGADNTITFRKNGIVIVESDGYKDTAEYKVKGKEITIFIEGDEETAEFRITKEKGKTVLILSFGGEEMKLYKK